MDARPPTPNDAPAGAEVSAFLAASRRRVETALDALLPAPSQGAPRLAEALRYSVEAGGKRLRPALAFAAAEAAGGDPERALPFACALELVHTYSLIHDDLPAMDDDDLRRGRPTSHKVFGEALAILTGDALHTLAFRVLLENTADAELARRLGVELAVAAGFDGMVGGQVDDLASDVATPDPERLIRIHERKTGALIRAACRGGGLCGGGDDDQIDSLSAYGHHLGLAFQIVDDVLDETGTAEQLGKTPGTDRREERLTSIVAWGLDGARARAQEHVEAAIVAARELPDPERLVAIARFVASRDR